MFLQEVTMSFDRLSGAAHRLGYSLHMSPAAPDTDRRLVFLYNTISVPIVTDIAPGFAQLITFPSMAFIHIHAPAGSNNTAARDSLFRREVAEAVAAAPSPPILIGDLCHVS